MDLIIYADGGSRGNPGPAACAFVATDNKGKVVHKEGRYLGVATNNVAEYMSVLAALDWAPREATVAFVMDSELVVRQLTGVYKIKNETLKKLVIKIKSKENEFINKITYKNVLREKNKEADRLVNETLDSAT